MRIEYLRTWLVLSVWMFAGGLASRAANVTLTSPPAGTTVSGLTPFKALAPGAASVDFWIAGHSIVSGRPPSRSPFSAPVDTTLQLDGPQQVVAVARDAANNITGISAPVTFVFNNAGLTSLSLAAPGLSDPLSGTVTFTVNADDARGIQMYVYAIDGNAQGNFHFNPAGSDDFVVDTAALLNGTHYFTASVVPNAAGGLDPNSTYANAQVAVQFTVSNPTGPIGLRTNFRNLYFSAGQTAPVRLAAFLVNNDGTSAPQDAVYSSDRPEVATVTAAGVVTPGPVQGIAGITVSGAGKSTQVVVKNVTSHGGFSHFTHDGRIVNSYEPDKSIWVRSLFNTSMTSMMNTPGFTDAFMAAASNVLNPGVYQNPAFYGTTSFAQFINTAGAALAAQLSAVADNNFYIVGTGDDFNRGDVPLNNTLTNPFTPASQSVVEYTMGQLVASGRVISLEMQDEIGCQTGAADCVGPKYRQEMALMNSFPARPPMSWPAADANVVKAWQGDPAISDYASLYWTFNAGQTRPAFGLQWSLHDLKLSLDKTRLEVYPITQIGQPAYLETFANGIGYIKRASGDRFHIGKDQAVLPGVKASSVSAQILYAAAMGYAGVRIYGYDGWSTTSDFPNDSGWLYHRTTDPVTAANTVFQQTGAGPFGAQPDVLDRWTAISNAFHAIQDLERYMLSPQIHAADLGTDITTGARQLSDGSGRMFLAVNLSDRIQTVQPDLSSYLYAGAKSALRYRVAGVLAGLETVSNNPAPMVTLAPGEALIWIFTAAGSSGTVPTGPGPRVAITSPASNAPVSGFLTLALAASDPAGVASAQFQLDGRYIGPAVSTAPYTALFPSLTWQWTLDTSVVSEGTHVLSAVAANAAGQQASAAPVSIVVSHRSAGAAVCTAVRAPGLVAEWPLADGFGPVAAETSGNSPVLTLVNSAWSTAGCKLSSCPSFDGAAQSGSANLDLSGTQTVTVSFWMNAGSYTDADGIAVEFGSNQYGFNGPLGGFMLNPNSSAAGGGYFEASLKGNAGFGQILFPRLPANSWHHYAFVFDKSAPGGSQIVPYVDGAAISYMSPASAGNAGSFNADVLNVMSRNGQGLFANGLLQDLRVYSRALSADEAGSLYQRGLQDVRCVAAGSN